MYEKAPQVIVSAGKVPVVADCICNYRHEASGGFYGGKSSKHATVTFWSFGEPTIRVMIVHEALSRNWAITLRLVRDNCMGLHEAGVREPRCGRRRAYLDNDTLGTATLCDTERRKERRWVLESEAVRYRCACLQLEGSEMTQKSGQNQMAKPSMLLPETICFGLRWITMVCSVEFGGTSATFDELLLGQMQGKLQRSTHAQAS